MNWQSATIKVISRSFSTNCFFAVMPLWSRSSQEVYRELDSRKAYI